MRRNCKLFSVCIGLIFFTTMFLPLSANMASTKVKMLKKKSICVGQKFKLRVKGANGRIHWKSTNKRIVKVNKKGVIRGIKRGKAVVQAKIGKKTLSCRVKVRAAIKKISYKLDVDNVGFTQVGYVADEIYATVYDPTIARVEIGECGFDSEENLNVADIIVYGKKDGKVNIILTNKNNKEKVVFKAIVKKPTKTDGKQKLIDYIIDNGTVDDLGSLNLINSKKTDDRSIAACIQLDSYEEDIFYSYVDVSGKQIVDWNMMITETNKDDYYIVVNINQLAETGNKENFVTVKINMKTFAGNDITFEDGCFGTPADDNLQKIANETTKNAVSMIGEILKDKVQLAWKDLGFENLV